MNLAEALLKADVDKITHKETKDFEVKRLSEAMGVPFILHLAEIPPKRVAEIQSLSFEMDRKGRIKKGDTYTMNMLYLCDGITNPEFGDKNVLKRFGVATKKELLGKILNSGEISDIAGEILKLCGYDPDEEDNTESDAVDTVKN